jgi:YopX protein
MKEETTIRDANDKLIREGDILEDNVPSKGIVKLSEGQFWVTTDYHGRDINAFDSECDLLSEGLISCNHMVVTGNIHDNEKPIYLKSLHEYNYRHGEENPKVIGFVMFTPDNLDPRPCFKVEYESDNRIDYINQLSLIDGHWEVVGSSNE